jgi:hypothetical protein
MIDPWKKAAECLRAAAICADQEREDTLLNLREWWIAIGNEKTEGLPEWEVEAARAARIHAALLTPLH